MWNYDESDRNVRSPDTSGTTLTGLRLRTRVGADTGEEAGESEVGGAAFLVLLASSQNRKLLLERKEEVIVYLMTCEISQLLCPEGSRQPV